MLKIKNDFLKKHLEEFSKLQTEEEKKAFWENFNSEMETVDESEKQQIQEDWKSNMSAIKERLVQIDKNIIRRDSET